MDTDCLIQLVFDRKPLWDQTRKDYHNRELSRKLWLEVSEELKESCDVIKTKWRGLRDTFRRELGKKAKPRPGYAGKIRVKSKWAYFESLMFLKDFVNSRGTSGNISPLEDTQEIRETDDDIVYEENSCNMESQNLQVASNTESKEFKQPASKRLKRDDCEEKTTPSKNLEVEQKNYEVNMDADYHFLMSLLPELMKVPAHRKLHARIKIQQILLEEQQEFDRQTHSSLSPNNLSLTTSSSSLAEVIYFPSPTTT